MAISLEEHSEKEVAGHIIADRAVREKVAEGRSGIRWHRVVKKVWEDKQE